MRRCKLITYLLCFDQKIILGKKGLLRENLLQILKNKRIWGFWGVPCLIETKRASGAISCTMDQIWDSF